MALLVYLRIVSCFSLAWAAQIELLECDPPDFPQWGGYGPRQDFYVPGDVIHYYCETDTYIGGNFYRRCEDTGDWSGDTPVCDSPALFSSTNQTTTAEPTNENSADYATDGLRTTCSSTASGTLSFWQGMFSRPGQLIRVMLFLPRGNVAYEIVMVKETGEEKNCASRIATQDRYEWTFHNCLEPDNTGVAGIKIKSLTAAPLQICEIAAHVLSAPTCVDPHLQIQNGRLQLSRKIASLVCDSGFTRSPDAKIECVRNGVWNRRPLACLEREWELGSNDAGSSDREPLDTSPRDRVQSRPGP